MKRRPAQAPELRVGQVWQGGHHRPSPETPIPPPRPLEPRTVVIQHLVVVAGVRYAWCVTNRLRRVRIRVARFRQTRSSYLLVHEGSADA